MSDNQATAFRVLRKTSIFKLYRRKATTSNDHRSSTGPQTATVASAPAQAAPAHDHGTDSAVARRRTFSGFRAGWTSGSETQRGSTPGQPGLIRRHTFSHFEASHDRVERQQSIGRPGGDSGSWASAFTLKRTTVRKQSTKISIARN